MKTEELNISRRNFLGTVAVASSAMLACSKSTSPQPLNLPPMLDVAPDGLPLRAGVIGCGGRGKGAALDFLKAGPNLQVVALADTFQDRLDTARKDLTEKGGQNIPENRCFVGLEAYKKVIDLEDVNVIITAAPPFYRRIHVKAAVEAKKHVFMEKPVCVDPVGARSIMDTGDRAAAFGLSVVTGTQRRHQQEYVETYKQIAGGAIGEIVAARCYWNQSQLWYRERQKGWSELEWMIRDWVNWTWLSGDHIVEQHVHNIDVINWFTGMHPVKAVGFGGRTRRVTGDQFDFFSVDYEMPNGMHVHSMCRQINGCANNVSEFIVGTKGSTNCKDKIFAKDGTPKWEYKAPVVKTADGKEEPKTISPYVREHIDLVTAIRTNKPINEAKNVATSTLTAIMGRISAYTGKEVTWDEMMASDFRYEQLDKVPKKIIIPVPGTVE